VIEIRNFKLDFGGNRGLSIKKLSIPDQGAFLIYGDNGTGKTSLIRRITGIYKDFKGNIELDGRDIREYSREETAARMSYLPQTGNMDVSLPVEDMVRQGLYAAGKGFFEEVKGLLGLGSFLDRDFSTLSGGEKQLVRIARAMVGDVRYSFLDEPDSFLSRKNRKKFLELVRVFSKRRAVVIISHGEMKEGFVKLLDLEED
jgi:iron complex transport system ATP-binding protein